MKTYIITSKGSDQYKIGKTSRSVEKRLKELQTGNPNHIYVHRILNGDYELELHKHFKHKRIRSNGEWFRLNKNDLRLIDNYEMPWRRFVRRLKVLSSFIRLTIMTAGLFIIYRWMKI